MLKSLAQLQTWSWSGYAHENVPLQRGGPLLSEVGGHVTMLQPQLPPPHEHVWSAYWQSKRALPQASPCVGGAAGHAPQPHCKTSLQEQVTPP